MFANLLPGLNQEALGRMRLLGSNANEPNWVHRTAVATNPLKCRLEEHRDVGISRLQLCQRAFPNSSAKPGMHTGLGSVSRSE